MMKMKQGKWKHMLKKTVEILVAAALVVYLGLGIYCAWKTPESGGMTYTEMLQIAAEHRGETLTMEDIQEAHESLYQLLGTIGIVAVCLVGLLVYAVRHPDRKWVQNLFPELLEDDSEEQKGL